MDETFISSASRLVPSQYLKQAFEAKQSLKSEIRLLIDKCQCPEDGWSDISIEFLLKELALMDSNNFPHNAGVGEREARIYSGLVAQRHFYLGHGIGRSGDLTEVQPKAAGSSLLYKLANALVFQIIKLSGARTIKAALIVPMATGMSIALCLLTIRKERPKARYVIWPRIDQKSCFKSIISAGFEPLVIQNLLEGDELRTDVNEIKSCIEKFGPESIAAILTTTSCFAPRGIDRLEEVSVLCKSYDIPHLINNAYGLQSSKCMHHIEQSARLGRVDAFVQSTDKNLMVPVGGAIISGYNKEFISKISRTYPGRASSSPIVDVFITLLSMGTKKYKELLEARKKMKDYLQKELEEVANKHKLRVLNTKNNPISLALTLPAEVSSELGSMLFIRGVSGTRVLVKDEVKVIEGVEFKGWGTHCNAYPQSYLTAAASIGMEKKDVDLFIRRLDKCLSKLKASHKGPEVDSSVSDSIGDSDATTTKATSD